MNDTPFQRTIPAAAGTQPGILTVDVSGRVLSCLSSTGKFFVRPDNGGAFEMSGGRYYGNPEAAEFGRLTLYNYTGADVTVDCIAGDKVYKPDGTISSVNAAITVSGRNAATYTKGYTYGLDALGGANDTAVFNGLDGANPRKSFCVFNTHAANVLNIYGANGVLMHVVDPRQSYVVESGGLISVKNMSASATTIAVCEVFYLP